MSTRFINKYAGSTATLAPINRSQATGIGFDTNDSQLKFYNGTAICTPIHDNGVGAQVARMPIYNPTSKAIVNASATALFDVARAANIAAAGLIYYQVTCTDGTDFQSMSGVVAYAHVDKAGVGTFTITEATGNQGKAVSSGTITLAWTYVTGTAKGTVKLQPTTSLTATVFTVIYTVLPMSGAVTIV